MNIKIYASLALVAAATLSGCGGGSTAAAPTQPPAAVTGVDTPKSVSVVTAN